MSGVGFLAAVKTFAPGSIRRRRRCDKANNKLNIPTAYHQDDVLVDNSNEFHGQCHHQNATPDVVPSWDSAPPITPPAAFLPPGYKKGIRSIYSFQILISKYFRKAFYGL